MGLSEYRVELQYQKAESELAFYHDLLTLLLIGFLSAMVDDRATEEYDDEGIDAPRATNALRAVRPPIPVVVRRKTRLGESILLCYLRCDGSTT